MLRENQRSQASGERHTQVSLLFVILAFRLPGSKFTWITRILVLATHHQCQTICFFRRAIGKMPKTMYNSNLFLRIRNEQITYLIVIALYCHKKMRNLHSAVYWGAEISVNYQIKMSNWGFNQSRSWRRSRGATAPFSVFTSAYFRGPVNLKHTV